jgi:hypothetical protein
MESKEVDNLRAQGDPLYIEPERKVMGMDWLALITNIVNRVPFERFLFRPRTTLNPWSSL